MRVYAVFNVKICITLSHIRIVNVAHVVIRNDQLLPVLSCLVLKGSNQPCQDKQEYLCWTFRPMPRQKNCNNIESGNQYTSFGVSGAHNNMICHYLLLVVRLVEELLLVKWLPHLNMSSSTYAKPAPPGPLLSQQPSPFCPLQSVQQQLCTKPEAVKYLHKHRVQHHMIPGRNLPSCLASLFIQGT